MDQFSHFNQTNNASNRVYINRNFNRIGTDGVAKLTNSNIMYFNPNFSHEKNTQHSIALQRDHTIRPRIHVNPNFIRPKVQDSIAVSSQLNTLPSTATYNQVAIQPIETVTVNSTSNNIQMATVSKSRYCLVRQNEKVVKTPLVKISLPIKSTQQTVKVNKYKSVSLNSVKKNLTTDKKSAAKSFQPTQIKWNQSNIVKSKYKISSKSTLNVQNNRFKYIKKNSTLLNSSETVQVMARRVSITHSKSILKTSIRQTKKIVTGALKKNNIPCPLFKKYGKCLRMMRGSCDYLHDKKHVSICRKFLKGICHDKHCLLSHDLTDKKMPTCYFYLQGNCTKDGCPYLHVKLNEKTKICPDFLRGYCEKGDKCVHRHVNVSFNNTAKSTKTKKRSFSTIINRNCPERTKHQRKNTEKEDNAPLKDASKNVLEKEIVKDQRYFKEVTGDNTSEEQYDLIKPTRCKLGILPSFIQL